MAAVPLVAGDTCLQVVIGQSGLVTDMVSVWAGRQFKENPGSFDNGLLI
jgi:hypothetical protein